MSFIKATRKKVKLRLAVTGPSGSGKTWGALEIAKGLGGKIACIDTEKGSASLYSNRLNFDVLELPPPYSPEVYIHAIKEAEKNGYNVLIIDSVTHEWNGSGGVLELLENLTISKYKGNSWGAWNEMTPRHRKFIDAMLHSNLHIIATGRSKTETAQVEENGKKKVIKLGMKTEQRDGFEYEFTVVLDIIHEGHYAVASKDRTGLFSGDPTIISEETGKQLREWLERGEEVIINETKPLQSLKSTPRDVFDKMDEKTQNDLRDIAMEVISFITNGDAMSAFDFIEEKELNADLKTGLWSLLESNHRSALKKISELKKLPPTQETA